MLEENQAEWMIRPFNWNKQVGKAELVEGLFSLVPLKIIPLQRDYFACKFNVSDTQVMR